jgi:ribosome-associated toxin RatA of RatAB toxin-antitoxin module
MWRIAMLLSCFLLAGNARAERAMVDVDAGLDGVSIRATINVHTDAATLWSTLTDYNRLSEFVPNLIISRVVSRPGRPTEVEQQADSGLLSFAIPDHVVLAMEEHPPNLIRFHAISGSVLAMHGEWRIDGQANPVRLTYRADVMPLLPPPPLVTEGIVRDEIGLRLEALVREAERRGARR